ncbi:MAG: prepilin-type N-terminal cleavage/methylation domain-containing protein [Gammaproteobacteria bacterium]|nr:prepilin-type N-terminal cleavage/methylation domain-containing protein [Gammaproteobacteria bacterium]
MPARRRREAGVTLMELMVVVGIVGILAAIAYPTYTQFVMQTNRTDATKTMQLGAQSLERCYSSNFTYIGCNVGPVVVNLGLNAVPSPNNYYTITYNIIDAQDYAINAVPNAAPQLSDNLCQAFQLLSSGQQTAQDGSNNDQTQACWGSN